MNSEVLSKTLFTNVFAAIRRGVYVIPKGGSSKEIQDGNWKDGKLNGTAHIR